MHPRYVPPDQALVERRLAREDLTRMSQGELLDLAWRAGCAGRVLMHAGQQALYDKYRAWEQIAPMSVVGLDGKPRPGSYPKIFGLPVSKRWGKTSWILWVKDEDARKRPGSRMRIATAAQIDIKEIVDQVAEKTFATCPPDIKPVYQGSRGSLGEGYLYPQNGSFLSLIGLDQRPNAGRGRRSDGDVVSEAAFVRHLKYIVKNVYLHSYQGIPHARLILESSAPADRDTAWELEFLPDFVARDAYYTATIEDNPRLTREEIALEIAQAGGREHPDCLREFFNVIAPPPGVLVVPEFSETAHVGSIELPAGARAEGAAIGAIGLDYGNGAETPEYAHAYVSMDPGTRDMFAILWGFWDFANARLVIQQDWAERGALTKDVIELLQRTEQELWGCSPEDVTRLAEPSTEFRHGRVGWGQHEAERQARLTYWDGPSLDGRGGWCKPNPYLRVGDTDASGVRLYHDLSNDYGINVIGTDKTDSKEARLSSLRDAFANGRIVVHPRCTKLISHLRACRWNKNRTDFERTDLHGHFDLVDALVYLWRVVSQNGAGLNPNPPSAPNAPRGDLVPAWAHGKDQSESALEAAFGVMVGGEELRWE